MKKICILDYGLGNIKSLYNALKKIGFEPDFFSEKKKTNYDIIFIPGVGSFKKGSNLILQKKYLKFFEKSFENNTIIFGICLGMQLMLSEGEENGINPGLNFIEGKVKLLPKKNIILPVIGWNKVKFKHTSKFKFLSKYQQQKFYFIHSYVANLKIKENELSFSEYEKIKYTSSIFQNNIFGTQFHPEKSGDIGLEFLKDFIEYF